ncbi:23S rRNA m(2)G2445 methyltransferase [Novipirellula galeiformis]|uniref:23S rRNA m(2)G2445 methyltransferase n=1 Tax=Novipirellula galeiformis TaxID=2528004 RepID=A0A5C6CFW5_9BACT|nr:class I SAM-dependent methyltransferase [Novipirellula galeiformis]TWU23062.1 23S rRNA m(2)G2445 methyltransferase [Novipirellula galeiformis]
MSNAYQLIDFGDGLKLESLSGHLVSRPSPAAEGIRRKHPQRWRDAHSVYHADAKRWSHHSRWPETLSIDCGNFRMPVRPTPFGHIGLFPEQAKNWEWLSCVPQRDQLQALNLFAYTGASTMALARAGFEVVHVDAAKPNVSAAKMAAAANDMSDAPIRYMVDDAAKFVAREVRRQRKYHTIVMDPPAYGHSPKGKTWRLERDLWPLVDDCLELIDPLNFRMLITGHSPQVDASDVLEYLMRSAAIKAAQKNDRLRYKTGRSAIQDRSGRSLDAGFYLRVESGD